MITAPRPPHPASLRRLRRPALFLVASGLLPFVISVTLALINWYEWRRVGGRGIDSDLRALLTVFGMALGFELLLTLLVFHPHRLGRLTLMAIAAISLPLLVTIEVLDSTGISNLFIERFLPLAVWTAVSAFLTIVICVKLVRAPSSSPR